METYQVVPELIDSVPASVATVRFGPGVEMNLGAELTPLQVKDIPTEVSWPNADPKALYAVVFIDTDAPSRAVPLYREILHWLVVNIPGSDLSKGETIVSYVGSGAPEGTGLHRYVLLVFKQEGKLAADAFTALQDGRAGRLSFNTRAFAVKHNLGSPVAGNLYNAQCDDYIRSKRAEQLATAAKEHGVVSDVLDTAPLNSAGVLYSSTKAFMNHGNELTPTQVQNQPDLVVWKTEPNALYTVLLTDPDAPSRADPNLGECLHWLVVNVPGTDLSKGETYTEYIGSGPPQGTGLHRYILLVFKQQDRLTLSRAKVDNRSTEGRIGFKTRQFIRENNLGVPIAGNFYQAQYDDYVPVLHKQLNFKPPN